MTDISNLKITYDNNIPFNSRAQTPLVTIYDETSDLQLTEGVDYTVEYSNNINAGEGNIYIRAISNNYHGELILPLIITPVDLANTEMSCGETNKDGCVNITNLKVTIDGYELRYGFDYAYEVEYIERDLSKFAIITLRSLCDNFHGNNTAEFKIEKIYVDIYGLVRLSVISITYNGDIQYPDIITELIENKDYIVEYPDSIDVGSYKIIVKGTGIDYIGSMELQFKISPRTIVDGIVDIGEADEFGCYDLDSLILIVNDKTLVNTEEYTIYYTTTEVDNGFTEASVTLSGIGNYCDTIEFTCMVSKKTIFAKREVILDKAPIYVRSYGYESCGIRSGTFYLWDSKAVNNRVKICSSIDNCGIVSLITGWVDISDLDYKRPIDDEEKDEENSRPKSGDEIKLYKVNLFSTFSDIKPSSVITGKFFISKEILYNNRIRICTFKEDVGIQRRVIGWINIDDV